MDEDKPYEKIFKKINEDQELSIVEYTKYINPDNKYMHISDICKSIMKRGSVKNYSIISHHPENIYLYHFTRDVPSICHIKINGIIQKITGENPPVRDSPKYTYTRVGVGPFGTFGSAHVVLNPEESEKELFDCFKNKYDIAFSYRNFRHIIEKEDILYGFHSMLKNNGELHIYDRFLLEWDYNKNYDKRDYYNLNTGKHKNEFLEAYRRNIQETRDADLSKTKSWMGEEIKEHYGDMLNDKEVDKKYWPINKITDYLSKAGFVDITKKETDNPSHYYITAVKRNSENIVENKM